MEKIPFTLTVILITLTIYIVVRFFTSPLQITPERSVGLGLLFFIVFCAYLKIREKD